MGVSFTTATATAGQPENIGSAHDPKKLNDTHERTTLNDGGESDGSSFKQAGVRRIEEVTQVWSKQMLIVTFILLYLLTFVDSLLGGVQGNLVPYVTSSFSQHGLLATTSIVASVLGGVSKLAIAKVIDIWGRIEGLCAMVFLIILGMVMKATCVNVEMYATAHTFYWVGHLGLLYILNVVVADMTTLKNRMIILGINSTPGIAATFAGPSIAELFLTTSNFRWAFGSFAIILVAATVPVALIFWLSHRRAVQRNIAQRQPSGRTVWESCKHYFVEFDVIGMFLTTAGWSLLLLPFNIVSTAPKGWATDYIIAMIVLGIVCLGVFVVWEKFFAPVPYFPFKLLTDRTIIGASLLYGVMFISIFCWDTYYGSYLQVVHYQSVTISGYVLNSFSLMSSFIAPFVGLWIRYVGEYKYTSFAGIPFVALGTALLIHFRHPGTHIGYLVMCQLFNGMGTGIWAATAQIGVMASVSHQETAVALALWSMFGSIGSAIGFAIAGALWTNVLPEQLFKALPEDSKDLAGPIYGDIVKQMSYPAGSLIREAIIAAYADVQRKMVIAGAAFLPIMVITLFMFRNINLKQKEKERGQVRGNIF